MTDSAVESAYALLERAVVHYRGQPVGTVAALDQKDLAAENYLDCFVRDFVPAALVYLNDGKADIVRNFLDVVHDIRGAGPPLPGYERHPGVMPASFRVMRADGEEDRLVPDFGELAIGRVAPVDSMKWWVILLGAYVRATGDTEFAQRESIQCTIEQILHLCVRDTFEVFPTLLVPDGSFMIDRRLGVYGHPLEIQALFYGALCTAEQLLVADDRSKRLIETVAKRKQTLEAYVRKYYWLDRATLNDIRQFHTEEFGAESQNILNIYPESIPDWVDDWLPEQGGYFVGNLGPGRMDFRFFSLGNLLAVLFGLATDKQAQCLFDLYAEHWNELIGETPLKICHPPLEGEHWRLLTGCDPKNPPWSYHNGGSWPALLWAFTGAAVKIGRREAAERAYDLAAKRLVADQWPEYYDGRRGGEVGQRANLNQIWSASALILSKQILSTNQAPLTAMQNPNQGKP